MRYTYIIALAIFSLTLGACKKFLEVQPKGVLIPEKTGDYEGLLNSPTMNNTFSISQLSFADDVYNPFDQLNQTAAANCYYWRPVITISETSNPEIWGPGYRAIYDANVIINRVMESQGGTEAQKLSIKGEALVVRAHCYLEMLAVFAKVYNPATAATDPGLPLVNNLDVTDQVPGRSTLKETFDYILNDVLTAIPSLPATNVNRYRVTSYVAYALLSRIYLYMGDFPNALKYTELVLKGPHSLLDYTTYTNKNQIPVYDLNPEVLWQRGSGGGSAVNMLYSDDLKGYFNSTDIRYSFLVTSVPRGVLRSSLPGRYTYGIGFPEMYLTKAELLARDGKTSDAMVLVNMLRKKRIKPASYTDQTAATPEEALLKVLAERRRELAFSGIRWFDMKRLDREGRIPEVKRINATTAEVEASLPPHSPNYTFEIPIRVLNFNPGMQRNH